MVLFIPAAPVNGCSSIYESDKTISESDNQNVIKDTMEKLTDALVKEEQRAEKERAFLFEGRPITIYHCHEIEQVHKQ
jgi:hypothetical protein